VGGPGTDSSVSGYGPVAESCGDGKKASGSINDGELFD
jgi:hypothetical protein